MHSEITHAATLQKCTRFNSLGSGDWSVVTDSDVCLAEGTRNSTHVEENPHMVYSYYSMKQSHISVTHSSFIASLYHSKMHIYEL